MTSKILTENNTIVSRSSIRAADNAMTVNRRAEPLNEDDVSPIVKSIHDNVKTHSQDTLEPDVDLPGPETTATLAMPAFDPNDLVGRTFLHDSGNDDGQRFRARIVEAINTHHDQTITDPSHIQFRVSVNQDQYEELLSYNDIVNYITSDEEQDSTRIWKFKKIIAHEGPLVASHPSYRGSKWNVMIEWETGEVTSEPLTIIGVDDPVTCAIYAPT
jgi:hypothetical protein